ncbi:MAG: hypothetical protein HY756_04975 [Nitrospirae bacterium]|nr:hypothetical protein [Nitrospirota bacterium]
MASILAWLYGIEVRATGSIKMEPMIRYHMTPSEAVNLYLALIMVQAAASFIMEALIA